MTKTSRYWRDYSTTELAARDLSQTVAVLPLAAIEQHGPHLPLAVDSMINEGIVAAAVAEWPDGLDALVLPAQEIGTSSEHKQFSGTLTYSPETAVRLIEEIGAGVAAAGVRRLVLFNSHGGNPPVMEIAALHLRQRHDMLAVVANWFDLTGLRDLFEKDELRYGIHGGAVETSIMLHLRPDLVRMEHAENFISPDQAIEGQPPLLSATGRVHYAWEAQDLNKSGAVGDATKASAEAGKEIVGRAAKGLLHVLRQAQAFDVGRFDRV